jgi:hypothetical protein
VNFITGICKSGLKIGNQNYIPVLQYADFSLKSVDCQILERGTGTGVVKR